MRIIELNSRLFGKRFPITVPLAKPTNEIGERASDQEILLHQAQRTSLLGMVVGIEDAGQRFRAKRFSDRSHEIAAAKTLKIESMRGRSTPQAQRIDRIAAIADDGAIIGNADERRRSVLDQAKGPVAQLERAAERHFDALIGTNNFPGIGVAEPIVRTLF